MTPNEGVRVGKYVQSKVFILTVLDIFGFLLRFPSC